MSLKDARLLSSSIAIFWRKHHSLLSWKCRKCWVLSHCDYRVINIYHRIVLIIKAFNDSLTFGACHYRILSPTPGFKQRDLPWTQHASASPNYVVTILQSNIYIYIYTCIYIVLEAGGRCFRHSRLCLFAPAWTLAPAWPLKIIDP